MLHKILKIKNNLIFPHFPYTNTIYMYIRQKKKLLAFSFANFETTRGSTGKANISLWSQLPNSKSELHLNWPKKVSPQFPKNQVEKVMSYLIGRV